MNPIFICPESFIDEFTNSARTVCLFLIKDVNFGRSQNFLKFKKEVRQPKSANFTLLIPRKSGGC